MGFGTQYPLGDKAPEGWSGQGDYSETMSYALKDGYLEFFLAPAARADAQGSSAPNHTRVLDLSIEQDCRIVIALDPAQPWRWATAIDAVTTKQPFPGLYFDLRYLGKNGSYTRENFPPDEACLQVAFGAKYNKDNMLGPAIQPYNLNLELIYADGTALPITIDPDIRNPGGGPG